MRRILTLWANTSFHWACKWDVSPTCLPQEEGQLSSPSCWYRLWPQPCMGQVWETSIWLSQGIQGEKRQHLGLEIPTYKAGIDFSPWNHLSPHHWYNRKPFTLYSNEQQRTILWPRHFLMSTSFFTRVRWTSVVSQGSYVSMPQRLHSKKVLCFNKLWTTAYIQVLSIDS